MEILKFPHPSLLTPTEPVTEFGQELEAELEAMFAVMKAHGGIGLAANQVGINKRMFVMEDAAVEKLFFVNPVILATSAHPANKNEGCLSAPGDFVRNYTRMSWVTIKYQDATGAFKESSHFDIWAVCAQHEIEHLEGKAFFMSTGVASNKRKYLKKKWGLK